MFIFFRNNHSLKEQAALGLCLSLLLLSFQGTARAEDVKPVPEGESPADAPPPGDVESPPGVPEEGCFPPCRAGYLCYEGKCIEACNPPCREDEKCTEEGDCVPRDQSVSNQSPPPEPRPVAEPQPDQPLISDSPEPRVEPPALLGGMIGIAGVASLCVAENGCNISEKEWGAGAVLMGGYRVLPWLLIDAQVEFAYLMLKGIDPNPDPVGANFTFNIGAVFLPLKRTRPVEPVFGLHFGYALGWSKVEADNQGTMKIADHGVMLEYMIGLDFNVSHYVTLGLHLVVQEPLYTKSCLDIEKYNNTPAQSECSAFEGDHSQFFFNPQLEMRIFF